MPPAAPPKHALNLVLEQGIGFHTGGDLERARDIYKEVLAEDEANAVALHYLGIYFFQKGEHDEALALIRQSCELDPRNAEWKNDLGNVLFAIEHYDAAIASYQSALQLSPRDHNIWTNLGSAQIKFGAQDAAIHSFRQAIDIMPEFVPALLNLGSVYETQGNRLESSIFQCRAFVLAPYEGKSKQMLGICFYFLGRLEEAAAMYRSWLEDEPGHPIAEHMYAACAQSHVPQRASDSYVEQHFDSIAKNFDVNLMQNLGYHGPWLINLAITSITAPAKQFDILDIGCGTGLCAPGLAPYAKRLTGVDLSGEMLARAAAIHLYDVLEKQEITHYLDASAERFDVVVACDTLIYFGDLAPLFDGLSKVLKSGGYFIFTTESILNPNNSDNYQLHASGRYRHAEAYVEDVFRRAGFTLLQSRLAKIREEAGLTIDGTLVVIQRTQACGTSPGLSV